MTLCHMDPHRRSSSTLKRNKREQNSKEILMIFLSHVLVNFLFLRPRTKKIFKRIFYNSISCTLFLFFLFHYIHLLLLLLCALSHISFTSLLHAMPSSFHSVKSLCRCHKSSWWDFCCPRKHKNSFFFSGEQQQSKFNRRESKKVISMPRQKIFC